MSLTKVSYSMITGAPVNVLDYGADTTGVANSTDAFYAAASAINTAGGGCLVIPKGSYTVGKQTFAGATGLGYAYLASYIIRIANCTKPVLIDFQGVYIKIAPGLKFGSFNPVTGVATAGISTNPDTQANIGQVIDLQINKQVTIIGSVEIDGNSANAVLGGHWGDTGYQCLAYGFYSFKTDLLYAENIYSHHSCLDGGSVRYPGLTNGSTATPSLLENCVFEYNARQGLSLTGGIGFTGINCKFNNNGYATFYSPPAAGLDIEAEGGVIRKAYFLNCEMIHNRGFGIAADSGDTKNVVFETCTVVAGEENGAMLPNKPGFVFKNCRIYGSIYSQNGSVDPAERTKYQDCYFSDETYNGYTHYILGNLLFTVAESTPISYERCSFNTSKSAVGRLEYGLISDCYFLMQAGTGYVINQGVQIYLSNSVLRDNTFNANITLNAPSDGNFLSMTGSEEKLGVNNLINTAGIVRWLTWSAGGGGTLGSIGQGAAVADIPKYAGTRLSLFRKNFITPYLGYINIYADTAAPSTGTYAVGDQFINSTPVVGQPKGWMCTVAGTPGTWVSQGNL